MMKTGLTMKNMYLFLFAVPALSLAVCTATAEEQGKGGDSLKGKIFGDSKPVDIRSEKLKVFHRDRYAVFSGNVVADRSDVQLFCDELRAEYDEKGLIERLICSGNVKVLMGTKEAHGREAVFDNRTEVVTITGDPWLKDGEDIMRGEIIFFGLADDTVDVEKPHGKYRMKPKSEKPSKPVN